MADISLRIKADFEQASAAFKKLEGESESLQKKTAALRGEYEKVDKSIQNNINKNQLNSIALTAVKGSEAALRAESAALQRQMIQLIKMGMDPQSEALAKLRNRYTEVQQQLPKSESGFSNLMATAAKFGMTLGAAGIAYKIFDIGKSAIETAGKLEQNKVAFEVLLGSAEKAKVMLTDIKQLADFTPFGKEELIDNAKLLLAYGVAEKDVVGTMSMLGDIAMGNKEKLGSLALAYGQIQAAGKLTGGDLRQLVATGFNPLLKMAGGNTEKFQKLKQAMEDGKISAAMVREEFIKATSAGGQFYQMNDRMSQTLIGRWSTFKDQLTDILGKIGNELTPTVSSWLTLASNLIGVFNGKAAEQPGILSSIIDKVSWLYNKFNSLANPLKMVTGFWNTIVDLSNKFFGKQEGKQATVTLKAEADKKSSQNAINDIMNKAPKVSGGQKKSEIQLYQDQLKKMQETEAWSFEERSKLASDYFAKSIEAEMAHGTTMQEWQAEQTSIIANNTKLSYDQRLQLMDEMRKAAQKKSADDIKRYAGYGVQIAGNASNMFADLQTVMENFGKKSKALAIAFKITSAAEAGINSFLAFTAVLADKTIQPTWLRIPMAGIILAAGLAKQAAILSTPIAETGLNQYSVPDIPAYRNDSYPVRAQAGETVSVTPKGESATGTTSVSISISDKQIFKIIEKGTKSGRINVNNKNIRRGVFAH